jgi:putative tricarboxylic transport membrane protein
MAGGIQTQRPAEAGRLPKDFIAGLGVLAFCTLAYWLSLDIKSAPAALAQNVQPATFPRGVIGVIAALTAVMMVLGLGKQERARRLPKAVMVVTGALMIGFVIAFDTLGPLVAMGLFCLAMPVIWGAKVSAALVAYAVIFPLAVYGLFGVVLEVFFPRGPLVSLIDGMI